MYGWDIGSLVIYTSTKANPMTEVNRVDGEQGNQWYHLQTDINVSLQTKQYLRIIVKGVAGPDVQGTETKDFSFEYFCYC